MYLSISLPSKIKFFFKAGIIIILFFSASRGVGQKIISEGTLVYNLSVQTINPAPATPEIGTTATSTISFKGSQSRNDIVSSLGSDITFHDSKTGATTILKEYSGQKLMITMTKKDWDQKYNKYEGIVFQTTNDSLKIAGYNGRKAIAKLKDGTSFIVYYCPDLDVADKDYEYEFKSLLGLPLQYEWQSGKTIYKYTLSKINFDPVTSSTFTVPKSGYRVVSYEEMIKN